MSTIKQAWGSSGAFGITLAALATDANLLAGRASAALDLTGPGAVEDLLVAGKITVGTSPTAGTIEVWAYASQEDTPTYPDGITGLDANKAITSANIKSSGLRQVAVISTSTTSDRTHPFAPVSLRDLFGSLPRRVGIFVVHATGVNLNATPGNHAIWYTPIYRTVG